MSTNNGMTPDLHFSLLISADSHTHTHTRKHTYKHTHTNTNTNTHTHTHDNKLNSSYTIRMYHSIS